MSAFISGSYAYGTPTDQSDLDLVIFADAAEAEIINRLSDAPHDPLCLTFGSFPVRFGKLNLIVCVKGQKFDLWKEGTDALKESAPVTREIACKFFKRLFEQNNTSANYADSELENN